MTAPAHLPASTQPDPHRLVAGVVVGAVGAIVFSIAIGSLVAGSRHGLPITTEAQAHALIAGAPFLALLGFAHLAVAAALALGRGLIRTLALVTTIGALIVALARFAMLLTGFDPTSGPDAGHPTTQGVPVLVMAAVAYAIAAYTASRSDRD
jgi:hypothetical protein